MRARSLRSLAALVAGRRAARRGPAGAENPCSGPERAHLLCPNLRIGPPTDLYVQHGRRPGAAAGDQRRAQPRPRPDGAARQAQRPALDAGQPADLPRRRRPHRPCRTGATLHFTDVGAYFGGSYWKVHQLARFELLAGRRRRPASAASSASARSSTTACATSSGPGPAGARPRTRHYPGCNQNPFQDRVTLGTSVGWSDIYPADYDKQWIDVAGLRGCFAFVMTVDPQHLLFESNEHDNTSHRLVRLPFRGDAGC